MGKVRGYSMKSSCAPYNYCKKVEELDFLELLSGNPELCENTAQLPRPTPRLSSIVRDIISKTLELNDIENEIRLIDERISNLENDMKYKYPEDDEEELEILRYEISKLEIEKGELEEYREKMKDLQRGGKSKKKKTKKKQFFNPKDPKIHMMFILIRSQRYNTNKI